MLKSILESWVEDAASGHLKKFLLLIIMRYLCCLVVLKEPATNFATRKVQSYILPVFAYPFYRYSDTLEIQTCTGGLSKKKKIRVPKSFYY